MISDQQKREQSGENASPYYILAIETSCDETSVAIVRDGREVLSNVVSSQIETHRRFGGVVPEIASRKHVESITVILEEALKVAGVGLADVNAIAVTQGPGLIGALLVGVVAAKSLALALDVPLIGTHHIAGHIYANRLIGEIEYPALALVVSGGHTELVLLEREGEFRIVGRTRDDAVGEAYDKVARALSFPYPGGPHVDKLAQGAEEEIELPRAWLEPDSYDFSFSGLKSAVLAEINRAKMKGEPVREAALARGFQNSVIDVVTTKAMKAAAEFGVRQLLLCGGVAANGGLRAKLSELCGKARLPLLIPPMSLCSDNAAMIASAADLKWRRGEFTSLDMKADPMISLEGWSVGKEPSPSLSESAAGNSVIGNSVFGN
ncbi:tRNA (adenosine(37)-N6)-threonylcarbamoyltransferase complex transferase subunit TsaD [Cohnella faecalis]|uniref:tRNA N6-adenosine threonylcarbamoyltransferase n=1 Tax=Cohnella faecalis TaxID=2315694 RepID=A0A398CE37_9BACL|nr:tRNA (adenosine(37)-N6)-threonylcarbamoyltransferase complex transferase subunit TsaD [Cohnella faecalis]RIE00973.1 tRNA (adenosine(37)-N6)-threonylcarbamoyltransferase complex transferase subunit TsaD [Cohnella faecalis]